MKAKDKKNIKCIIHYCEATASDITNSHQKQFLRMNDVSEITIKEYI